MTNPDHEPYDPRIERGAAHSTGYDAGFEAPRGDRPGDAHGGRYGAPHATRAHHGSGVGSALRDPRRRLLLLALSALLVVTALGAFWYADPRNRTRNELVDANERLLQKQREVEDAHRLLEQKVAELRAAKAQADLQATRYQGALEAAARDEVRDEVATDAPAPAAPGGAAPATGAARGTQGATGGTVSEVVAGDVYQPLLGQPIRIGRP